MKHIKTFETTSSYSLLAAINTKNKLRFDELLDAGVDIEQKNSQRETPLICAAYTGDVYMIKKLIEAGANINTQDEDGYTPLINSIIGESTDLNATIELINAGADWTLKSATDRDFLSYLSSHSGLQHRNTWKDTILKMFPEKYEEYLAKIESDKYNL